MTDRVLELDDIQGDVLAGFNTDFQVLIGLALPGASGAQSAIGWVSSLADRLTTVDQIRAARDDMKARDAEAPLWLAIAVSPSFLKRAAPDVWILDDSFNAGLVLQAKVALADRSDSSTWTAGAPKDPIDVLLMVGGNVRETARKYADDLLAEAHQAGMRKSYLETGVRLSGAIEHFGFRDGISQPDVLGDRLTADNAPPVGAGNFIFGYPRALNENVPALAVDARKITDNGSLLVFRRLGQKVDVFKQFCADEAARLQNAWPGLEADHLAALIVGRWPSGAPAHPAIAADPGIVNDTPENSFTFSADDEGRSCPFGSHIRKVNPRAGVNDERTVPRLLRRGIPFGLPYAEYPDGERGLLFMAYASSIQTSFEFITGRWMNNPARPGLGDDVLLGRPYVSRSMPIMVGAGQVIVETKDRQWIYPSGGAYLFAPGKRGLRALGTPPSPMAGLSPALLVNKAITQINLASKRLKNLMS